MEEATIKNINVFLLGLSFMLIFTAFQTMGNVQTAILDSARNVSSKGYVPGFSGSGYSSLAIIYLVFSISNWFAPSAVCLLGPRLTLVVGGTTYAAFIAQFYKPQNIFLYGGSTLLGLGAALIWTAQGTFLTLNSDESTISRNSGIFWAMLQSSMLIGNSFVFFEFRGLDDISFNVRTKVTIVLLSICTGGIFVFLFMRRLTTNRNESNQAVNANIISNVLNPFRGAFKILTTRQMTLLSVTFLYMGLVLTFISGVYGSCLGFSLQFGQVRAKSLIGLHGICLGVGEIIGGVSLGIFGKSISRRGRDVVVMFGTMIQILAYFLVFLNLPNASPFGNTVDSGYIASSKLVALLCSILLGIGDACFNTQVLSLLAQRYTSNSSPAFALFKFFQSTSAAIAFFYSSQIYLYVQLGILFAFCTFGCLSFCFVEWNYRNCISENETPAENQTIVDNETSEFDASICDTLIAINDVQQT